MIARELVNCDLRFDCTDAFKKCDKCKNNRARNERRSFFVEANDNPKPKDNPKLTYTGPAEQTEGYKCPVCNEYTNPYQLREDHKCSYCGWTLNV